MTGPSRPNPPIETRLDELLDQLVSGDESTAPDDPELQGLTTLARAIRDDDRIEWPDETFPDQLTANLHSEIRPANGRVTMDGTGSAEPWDDQTAPLNRSPAAAIPESEIAELTGRPARLTDLRRLAQIAAAVVGFGLLTLVLVAVFRGFDDETPAAVGTGDEDRPPQLAVTMQTDPVNGNPDIFLVSLDGSEPVNLTDNPANDTMPAWSPDGSKLAFISDRSGEDAIYIMEADGSYVRELDPFRNHPASNPEVDWHYRNLAWSPDGSVIAVMRYPIDSESVEAQILIVDAGGAGLRIGGVDPAYPQLTLDQTPVWSPDSQWLVFETRNQDESRLAVTGRAAGYRTPPHLLPDSAAGTGPSWSVNNEIAVASGDGVTIVEFTGEFPDLISDEIERLSVPDLRSFTSVEWSPDGNRLAFTTSAISGTSVWVANSDGTELTAVPESATGKYLSWSPDGSQLAFLRFGAFFSAESTGHDLMLYDVESASLTTVLDTGFSGPLTSPPVWRPIATEDEASTDATPTAPPVTPTDTPAVPENGEELLTPPLARLHAGNESVEASFGSYSWQFSDPDQTFAHVEAPFVPLTGEPLAVAPGEPLAVSIRGEEFTRPPETTTIEVYNLDENQRLQTGPAGRPEPDPQFTIRTNPVLTIELEVPAGPSFTLNLPPDRYAIVVRSDWGMHPNLNREIFVTWVFGVELADGAEAEQATLVVQPTTLTCADSLRMDADGFPPDEPITTVVREIESGETYGLGISQRANPDGEFTTELSMALVYPGCQSPDIPPNGLRLEILIAIDGEDGDSVAASAEILLQPGDSASPEEFEDDPRVQQAIAQVREFLGDPTAELTLDSIDETDGWTRVHLSRKVPGLDDSEESRDIFVLYPGYETSIATFLVSNTASARPENPVSEEQARTIAEDFYDRHDMFDNSLTPIEAPRIVSVETDEEFYNFIWQLQRDGVWLPTIVQVVVSADTGLVAGYTRLDFPYDGPLTPTISESEARQIAEDRIANDPELAGATIDGIRLAVTLGGFENAIEDDQVVFDMEARLRLVWEFTIGDPPTPGLDVIWIDAMTGERLTTGS